MIIKDLKRTIDCLTMSQRGQISEIWAGTLLWGELQERAGTANTDVATYEGIPIKLSKDIPESSHALIYR